LCRFEFPLCRWFTAISDATRSLFASKITDVTKSAAAEEPPKDLVDTTTQTGIDKPTTCGTGSSTNGGFTTEVETPAPQSAPVPQPQLQQLQQPSSLVGFETPFTTPAVVTKKQVQEEVAALREELAAFEMQEFRAKLAPKTTTLTSFVGVAGSGKDEGSASTVTGSARESQVLEEKIFDQVQSEVKSTMVLDSGTQASSPPSKAAAVGVSESSNLTMKADNAANGGST